MNILNQRTQNASTAVPIQCLVAPFQKPRSFTISMSMNSTLRKPLAASVSFVASTTFSASQMQYLQSWYDILVGSSKPGVTTFRSHSSAESSPSDSSEEQSDSSESSLARLPSIAIRSEFLRCCSSSRYSFLGTVNSIFSSCYRKSKSSIFRTSMYKLHSHSSTFRMYFCSKSLNLFELKSTFPYRRGTLNLPVVSWNSPLTIGRAPQPTT